MIGDYADLYRQAGQQYGVDPALLMAQGQAESSGNPDAVSDAGAVGLAQLMPATAKSLGVTDPTDPAQAIPAQARLMAQNIKRYGDIPTALMAYHGGTDESQWGAKTKAYPGQVMAHYQGAKVADNDDIDADYAAAKKAAGVAAAPQDDIDADYAAAKANAAKAQTAQANAKSPIGVGEDLALTGLSSIAKGVGKAMQIPEYAENALMNTVGEAVYGIRRAAGYPQDDAMYNRLTNLNPLFTGNTLPDALIQSATGIAGLPAPANPLTGDILHDPQTMPARFEDAAIQGLIGAKISSALPVKAGTKGMPVISAATGIGGGIGAQAASEALPGSPTAQLIGGIAGGGAGKLGKDAVTPKPLPADVADTIKGAEGQFGIKTPSGAMTSGSGGNLVEDLAGKADTDKLAGHVNKAVVDMIGANDNGEGHTILNPKSYLDAEKNNNAAYNQVFADIGNVPLANHIGAINDALTKFSPAAAKEVGTKLISLQNPDGTISAAAIKDLTKQDSVLQKLAANKTDTIASGAAQDILNKLDEAMQDKATPEQYAEVKRLDVRYKAMKDLAPVARQVGAGQQASIPAVQATLNKSFSNISGKPLPPTQLSNYLNTISPSSKVSGGVGGIKRASGEARNKLVDNAADMAALMSGHPLMMGIPIARRGFNMAVSKGASKFINSDWYRNRLLQNAAP
jgi:hypothetical protein